jgi:hypothetical protein
MCNVKEIADKLVLRLKAEGFTVQRYDAFSTESVYLKLDFGIVYTVRISGHSGKKHLKYTYNLIAGHNGKRMVKQDGTWRQFFNFNEVDALVTAIISWRKWVKEKYHPDYPAAMEANRIKHEGSRGFWQQAKIV